MIFRKLKPATVVSACFGLAFVAFTVTLTVAEWLIGRQGLPLRVTGSGLLTLLSIGALMGAVFAGVVAHRTGSRRATASSLIATGFFSGVAVFTTAAVAANGLAGILKIPTLSLVIGASLYGIVGAGITELLFRFAGRSATRRETGADGTAAMPSVTMSRGVLSEGTPYERAHHGRPDAIKDEHRV